LTIRKNERAERRRKETDNSRVNRSDDDVVSVWLDNVIAEVLGSEDHGELRATVTLSRN
jgi:hypothetical protein